MKNEFVGCGAVIQVKKILRSIRPETVFIVTGGASFVESGAKDALSPHLEGLKAVYFDDFTVNPKIKDVKKGILRFGKSQADMIIAVGGGSTIDMAKLINTGFHQPGSLQEIFCGRQPIGAKGVPLTAIPTTAGAGSEATHFAVVYIEDVKYSVAHATMHPDYAIVDPTLSYSLPQNLSAVTGLDALCQAIESYWAVGATKLSQRYAAQAIELLWPSIKAVFRKPDDKSRYNMAVGAHLAGKAINISKTTGPHAISYPLTTLLGIPHGHAVALTLASFFLVHGHRPGGNTNCLSCKPNVSQKVSELCKFFGCSSPEQFAAEWERLLLDLNLESSIQDLENFHPKLVNAIIESVNTERLSNNPARIDRDLLALIIGNPAALKRKYRSST